RQLAYWRAELESVPPLRLPTSRSRPPLQSHRGRARTASIDGELADRLRALARAEGATLHMVLLAGFALVLSRWSGQDDFAVGTPVAGRTRQETEGLIGYFINTLALRVRPAGSGSFSELVAAIRATSLGAYSHQDVPFEAVLNALKPPRDLARSPIFQVWFNLLNFGDDDASFRSLEVRPFGAEGVASEFDLNLYVAEEARGISLRAIYAAELFEPSTLDELLRQFVAVLRQAAASPASGLAVFSLVTDAAEAALPDPAEPLDASWRGSVHEIFSDNVRKTPSATAVVDDAGVMSYGELEARADRTAGWLTRHGVRKGDVVAIHARRSASTVVAILGVLKAGAAFSLLDPAHPAARLIACLTESPPRALIAVEDSTAPAGDLLRFIDGDLGIPRLGPAGDGAGEGIRATADRPGAFRGVAVGPDDLACVTFTSGSAGRPKPVRGRHGSLTHFQPYLAARFGIGPADRFSMLSGLSHDPLQRDIVTALLAGASIRIPDPAEIDPARLARWAARERITVMNLTPAMSRILAPPESDGHLPDLRLVFLVGEQLTRGDVENLRRAAPLATIVNLYGTTESQRAVGHFVISAGAPLPPTENVPAGIGMPGAQVLVRTDAGHGAGLFELGEIWIRSPHLALGYADEAATRERFSGEGGSRAYRTGDLGRHLLDGAVAVAGRRDGQMNVRGFRIEPGEIEAALAAHPGIREAAVLLDPSGRLIGYVACADASLDPVSLREALRRRLPEPMVPAKIVVLDRIPLTPNGKIDRRALPAPDWDARPSFTAPRTADEEVACALFADVLDLERVSIDDSFFDLGGHSLLATRLLSRLRASHDVEIALRSLFEAPTPAGLARSVAAARRTGPSDRPALARADSADRRRLSYAQRRLWVLDRLDPGSPAYNVAS
ncbi:MAG TPA: amino acid adenylation domain-containing protein, partial [Verrucomicrobiae bacterium]|nr:amino acid adenylation domain-containing protein [Verrucomicrobiae bacterium]